MEDRSNGRKENREIGNELVEAYSAGRGGRLASSFCRRCCGACGPAMLLSRETQTLREGFADDLSLFLGVELTAFADEFEEVRRGVVC